MLSRKCSGAVLDTQDRTTGITAFEAWPCVVAWPRAFPLPRIAPQWTSQKAAELKPIIMMQWHMKVVRLNFAITLLLECRSHAEYTPVQQLRLSSGAPKQCD